LAPKFLLTRGLFLIDLGPFQLLLW